MEISKQYLAGIFDGEGCVSICKSTKNIGTYTLAVALGMRCPIIPKYLKDHYAGGFCKSKNNVHIWQVRADRAVTFLQDVEPYLIVKKKQAQHGIDFQCNKLKVLWYREPEAIQKEFERRELMYWQMRQLNSEWSNFAKRAVDSYKLLENNVLTDNEVQSTYACAII